MHTTLASTIWPQSRSSFLYKALLVVTGTALLIVSAKLKVPFWPVPMTMQTFVVLGLGMAYGWRLAGATMVLYLAEGAIGLPVFAGTPEQGIGVAYMLGGTGGYLIDFVLAAMCCGYLAERGWDRRPLTTALAMLLGNVAIYVPGLLWLGGLFGWDKPILEWGLLPFVPGDLAKIALAMAVLPLAWRMLGNKASDNKTSEKVI